VSNHVTRRLERVAGDLVAKSPMLFNRYLLEREDGASTG